jgi:DNA-binding sugar fermentation-stimulating protein
VQRTDVNSFAVSVIDPEYRNAVKNALENGVEIIVMVIEWNKNGEAYFVKDNLYLEIN